MSIGEKLLVGAFFILGVATLVFGLLILISGVGDWLFTDTRDTVEGLVILTFMGGPLVAIAGVYAWRRADADGRSTKRARLMIVVGTLGMAGVAGYMYWTIIGPVIAFAIVAYWVYKIMRWRVASPNRS